MKLVGNGQFLVGVESLLCFIESLARDIVHHDSHVLAIFPADLIHFGHRDRRFCYNETKGFSFLGPHMPRLDDEIVADSDDGVTAQRMEDCLFLILRCVHVYMQISWLSLQSAVEREPVCAGFKAELEGKD